MIAWLHPIALVGLVAIAGPVAVHLLRRQRAERLLFPSLRFVATAHTSSIRLRMPSDRALLALRVAIVGFAAVALAQPFAMTAARRNAWNARLSRAIVIDPNVSASQQATEAVSAESQAANAVHISRSSLRDGVSAAVDSLSETPSRREIVVISDFRHGALTAPDIVAVPAPIGLRFITVDASSASHDFRGDTTLGAPGVAARVQQVRVTSEGTDVQLKTVAEDHGGLRLEAPPHRADRLQRSVARAGAPAPDPREPLVLEFGTAAAVREKPDVALAPWMIRTISRMRRDPLLVDAARTHVRKAVGSDLPGIVIARDRGEVPVVSSVKRGKELVLLLEATPDDYLSAATLQSALVARRGEPRWDDREVARIPASTLAAWSRVPGRLDPNEVRTRAPGDARWMWGFVLALLAIEAVVRRQRKDALQGSYARVA
jgi:aerotolerance regulator-like protein